MTLLYAHICVDRRHRGVIELLRETIERREFPEWPLAFFCAQSYHETRMLPTEDSGARCSTPGLRRVPQVTRCSPPSGMRGEQTRLAECLRRNHSRDAFIHRLAD